MPSLDLNRLLAPPGRLGVDARVEWQPRASSLTRVQSRALALSAIAALFVILHVVWFIGVPADLDSFNFILGVRRFDVVHHQPHPPGAPVYIAAGKAATWLWRFAGLPFDPLVGPEASALGALSLLSGTLSIFLLGLVAGRREDRVERAWYGTLILASAPLFWLLAARSVSDIPGLLLILTVYLSMASGRPKVTALLSGIAAGLRVQTVLLTVPVLIIGLGRARSWKTAALACGWFAAGVVSWLLPMVAVTGAGEYWAALTKQAQHDWSNPLMFAAAPTLRHGASALINTFAMPWGNPTLAAVMLIAAAIGAWRLLRTSPRGAAVFAAYAAPYLLFHLVLQETNTIRYAMPIMLGVAYLAGVAIEGVQWRWRGAVILLLIAPNLFVSVRSLYGVARTGSPAIRLLAAMHRRAAESVPAFVIAHENLRLPRLQRILPAPPPWTTVRPKAPYEWRALLDHWKRGATAPVWFVADPRRTDLSLLDRRSQHVLGSFKLDVQAAWILRGVRPRAFTWLELRPPAWIAVRGFALTPETGGLAARDRDGPAFNGAVAMVRRYAEGAVIAVAGRHIGGEDDPDVRVVIEIDGRPVSSAFASARERHYRALVHLRPNQLAGDTPYATVTIRSSPVAATTRVIPVTVEHFDYQPGDGALFSFSSGWHEPELRPRSGLTWRWATRRASVLIHRPSGTPAELVLAGDAPMPRGLAAGVIRVTSGTRILDAFPEGPAFSRRVVIPGDVSADCDVSVTITSSSWFVPRDVGQSDDRRELAFRAFAVEVNPLNASK